MNKVIDADTIAKLLQRGSDYEGSGSDYLRKKYAAFQVEQVGPLRYHEPPWKPCASRGCGSTTPYRVNGIPRCTVHALRELNDMLVERGGES